MKIINVSPHSRSIKHLIEQASTENIILRAPDGREFVLAEIDDFDREIELARQSDRLMKFLDERGKQEQTISLSDARDRLGTK
jgi:hypothetical protein